MILDTSFLIRLYQERESAFEKAIEIQEENEIPRVPAPVIQELEYGAAFLEDEDMRRKIRNITLMYPNEELAVADHKRAGKLHAQADKQSTGDDAGVDDVDAMIAAVAQRYDEPVLTENIDDFAALGVLTESF